MDATTKIKTATSARSLAGILSAIGFINFGCSAKSPEQTQAGAGVAGFSSFGNGGAATNPFPTAGAPAGGYGGPVVPGSGGIPTGPGNTGSQVGFGNEPGSGNTGNAGGFGNTGNAGGFGNTGVMPPPSGGVPNIDPGTGGTGAGGGMGVPVNPGTGCAGETMPPVTDYTANGPFQTKTVTATGPDGQYTMFRPATLGENGMKHPVATWGNGITTTPDYYPGLLGAAASHGFVIIASNSTSVTAQLMTTGLDWMIQQNDVAGEYQGKLNTTCLVTFGYSLGGGASVGSGAHANVVATASMHGVTGAANTLHAPLLLLTSETDTFVTPSGFVTPTFNASTVPTFYGTLSTAGDKSNEGHLIPVDGALSIITDHGANLAERAAVIAWLRLWVYGDQGAKRYFYGDDCILCKAPWAAPQRKNWQ